MDMFDEILEKDEKKILEFRPHYESFKRRLFLKIFILILSVSLTILAISMKLYVLLFVAILLLVIMANLFLIMDRKMLKPLFNEHYLITDKRLIVYDAHSKEYNFAYLKDLQNYMVYGMKPCNIILNFKDKNIRLLMVKKHADVLEKVGK